MYLYSPLQDAGVDMGSSDESDGDDVIPGDCCTCTTNRPSYSLPMFSSAIC